jgi:hypothetical protein
MGSSLWGVCIFGNFLKISTLGFGMGAGKPAAGLLLYKFCESIGVPQAVDFNIRV